MNPEAVTDYKGNQAEEQFTTGYTVCLLAFETS